MGAFLAIVLGLPTVIFTVLMVFVALYWLLVILGAVDLELFEIDLDLDLDVDVDVIDAVDIADVADVADVASVADAADAADAAESVGVIGQVLGLLGFGRVPVMVLVTLFVFTAWCVSFLSSWLVGPIGGSALVIASLMAAILGGSTMAGLVAAAMVSRPLSPLFRTGKSRERSSLIGETVELTTGRVDGRFGQGNVSVSDADLLVQIRCDRDNELRRGDSALIISFDKKRDAFVVEPVTRPLLEDHQATQTSSSVSAQPRSETARDA